MATFADDFNRADNASLGSNWASSGTLGTIGVLTNQAWPSTFGPSGLGVAAVATGAGAFTADHSASVVVSNLTSGDQIGPAVRVTVASNNWYYAKLDGTADANRRIVRVSGGTETLIGTVNLAAANGDTFLLQAVGSTISVFRNGTLVDSVTDATHATGQPGMAFFWGNVRGSRMDGFLGADIEPITQGGWGGGDPWARSLRPLRNPHLTRRRVPFAQVRGQRAEQVFEGGFFGTEAAPSNPLYIGAAGSAVRYLGATPAASRYLGPRTLF